MVPLVYIPREAVVAKPKPLRELRQSAKLGGQPARKGVLVQLNIHLHAC